MSSLTVEEDPKWTPTHVQVTVLKARGLRGKGKHGTSDVYTIIQLGKEKYSTCVAEKTTEPEWKEECTFELHPGVLDGGGRSGFPAGSNELVLTVMHQALIGLDVFLGQAVIQLDKIYHESRYVKNEWYRLHSKTGKKEKERGDIQITVQFTRNNLTASMYDLVMKDKGVSTFGKLKERMKGKRRSSDEDSQSAVLPGGYGSLCRMRQRLPSDGGGEEDYEDDEGGEVRRSKMRTFFLRGKLRKSSDTRSSTSLGSESSESSSRGGSLSPTAGISVVVSDLSNSPSNSSNLTADNSPEHTANLSPKSSSSLKCEFGDEAGEITIAVPQPTVCVNGSHAYNVQPLDPGSGKPANSLGLGLLQKSLPLSMSLQNLSQRAPSDLPKGPAGDGRRWSFDKPGEEEKAAIAAALEKSGPMLGDEEAEEEEERLRQAAPLRAASSSTVEWENQGRKQKKNLFSHGRSDSAGKGQSQFKVESERTPAATEEKHRGWFGSKDSHSKPSLTVSPKLEPSIDPHPPPLPPSLHPSGPPVDPASPVSPLHHTNPFCHSQSTPPPSPPPPPISPCNPFFSLLQHNPFYEDMLTAQPLKPHLPPLPYLSSSRPPISQLFPQASNPDPTLTHKNPKVEKRPLPPTPAEEKASVSTGLSNPFTSAGQLDPDPEWDESFEAFAAGRLQSPEDPTTDCKTQRSTTRDHRLQHCNNKEAFLPTTDADKHVNDTTGHQLSTEFGYEAHKAASQVTNTNMHHFDSFAQFLETIPEHTGFEGDSITSQTNAATPAAHNETNQTNSFTANTSNVSDTNMHQVPHHASSVKLNSSSPDPGSSGLGSSAEEDFPSGLSSYSDKFSASSAEEAEVQNFESVENQSSDLTVVKDEDDITDRSHDLSLADDDQNTVIQLGDEDEKVDVNVLEESLGSLSELQPKPNISSQPDSENGGKGEGEFKGSLEDFSNVLNDSSLSVSNTTDVVTTATPDVDFCSTHPTLHIITSSPDVTHSSSDSHNMSASLKGQDESRGSPVPFRLSGDFLNTSRIRNSPSHVSDDAWLHSQVSHQSSSSFLQSLYVSTDSQSYQTCESHLSSKCSGSSEPNNTLHSANSTLCGELDDSQTTTSAALGREDSASACKPSDEDVYQTDQCEETVCGAEDKTAIVEPSFMIGDDFGLKVLPAALTNSCMSDNPRKFNKAGVESRDVILGEMFSKSPKEQGATLHRSQSEGTLAPAFEHLLLPSFGSDPGAIQDSSSAQPGPDLPSLTSFAPPLALDTSSPPVAPRSLSFLANAAAQAPPGTARAAAPNPKPQETERQQAANQQNSPHPVKPLTTAMLAEEKRTEGRSVLATGLEKLKSTIHPGKSSQISEQEDKKKSLTEGAGSYYHLNHSELVTLLVQREAELERQKAEFERQRVLLAKREVELKRLKPQVRDLEDYIDTLLVRIMEQKPTLLQVRSKLK